VLAALAGVVVCGVVYFWYEAQIATQQGRNNFLQTENRRLDEKIKEIANLQAEIAALRARQQALPAWDAVQHTRAFERCLVHILQRATGQWEP